VQYKDEETGMMLCLQAAFPTNDNGDSILYDKIYVRVGNCYTRKPRGTHFAHLIAHEHSQKGHKCS